MRAGVVNGLAGTGHSEPLSGDHAGPRVASGLNLRL
jgi:hypothetical protein